MVKRTRKVMTLALAVLLILGLTPAQAAADSESIDAVMARLTNDNLATEFARLSPSHQKGVRDRLTVAQVTGFLSEKAPKRGNAAPLAAGCWTRSFTIRGTSLIGIPLWDHVSVMNWCENGSTITSGNGYGYGRLYQLGWFYRGTRGWTSEGGVGFSYYGDFQQSTFELCLNFCIQQANPWTNNHTVAGGAYGWTDWGR